MATVTKPSIGNERSIGTLKVKEERNVVRQLNSAPPSDLSKIELFALIMTTVLALVSAIAAAFEIRKMVDPLGSFATTIKSLGGTLTIERDQFQDATLTIALANSRQSDLSFLANIRHYRIASLDLSHMPIDDDQLQYVTQLLAVESLNLSGTKITDAGAACLPRIHGLQRLNLTATHVTASSLAVLAKCHELNEVNLAATAVLPADAHTVTWTSGTPKVAFE